MSILFSQRLRRTGRVLAMVAAGLVVIPALTGCGPNPVETFINNATGGNIDIRSTSVPSDFPSDVPLIHGAVISSLSVGKGADKVWTVVLKVNDPSAADHIKSELEAAGFTQEFDQAAGGAAGIGYRSSNYAVLVAVTKDGDHAWAASYVVSAAPN